MDVAFSTGKSAVVGYAQVEPDGSTPNINSGIAVERLSIGVYRITLSGDLEQFDPECIFDFQPQAPVTITQIFNRVEVISKAVREVTFIRLIPGDALLVDVAFDVFVFRMLQPPFEEA